jgi:hypothetical protein
MKRRSYAVWWDDGDGRRHAGKLELGALHVLLSGNGSGRLALALDDLESVEYVRGELLVAGRAGPVLRVGSLDAPGALLELSDHLRRLAVTARSAA